MNLFNQCLGVFYRFCLYRMKVRYKHDAKIILLKATIFYTEIRYCFVLPYPFPFLSLHSEKDSRRDCFFFFHSFFLSSFLPFFSFLSLQFRCSDGHKYLPWYLMQLTGNYILFAVYPTKLPASLLGILYNAGFV